MSTPSLARPIPQTYVVRAVRRTRNDAGVTPPVADEEIVDALLRNRHDFEDGLRIRLDKQFKDCDVVGASLRDVRLGGGVLIDLEFKVKSHRNLVKLSVGFTEGVVLQLGKLLVRVLREPVAVSVTAAPNRRAKATSSKAGGGWGTMTPVLAAIASGIGVIGFVTFVGGVFVWARLNGNGFPAAPALSVYPRQDLLVIGASTLVPQVLIALGAVAGLTAFYLILRQIPRVKEREQLARAGHLDHLTWPERIVCVLLLIIVSQVPRFLGLTDEVPLAAPVLVLIAVIAGLIGLATRRFAYVATTAFLGIGVLMSYVAFVRARNDKQIRGAALIRSGQTPVTGIYLTEGAGRVYLAQIEFDRHGVLREDFKHIIGVDKSEVTDLAVAAAQPPEKAFADAQKLKSELCGFQPTPEKPAASGCAPTPTPTPPKPPAIPLYAGGERTLDPDGTVLFVLPAFKEDAIGVVSFITREPVRVDGADKPRRISLATKPFRGQAGHPVRIQLRLSTRARRSMRAAGGAMPVSIRIVAVGATGLASRDSSGCVVLRAAAARAAATC
ncbi:hypothetical protein [Solirubrobacter soli]|uniref:hypothetical protein n=1 Tax=Solirubrobacter soli TaxID=363832 RepID=UPI00048899D6|nr:hypothetical protein [Solirubrobacter soli]